MTGTFPRLKSIQEHSIIAPLLPYRITKRREYDSRSMTVDAATKIICNLHQKCQ